MIAGRIGSRPSEGRERRTHRARFRPPTSRRWLAHKSEKTNIDVIVGKTGRVTKAVTPDDGGQVKVGYEEWRAKADEEIAAGEKVEVVAVSGVTLTVKKIEGGK